MSTPTQEYAQASGPHAPEAGKLVFEIMRCIPWNCIIEAVSINGQTGVVTIEYSHEELQLKKEIQLP